MDRYCPECNSTMTPSLVGYLCPECGNVQRFYTMTGTQLQSTSLPIPKSPSVADSSPQDKLPSIDDNKPKVDVSEISAQSNVDGVSERNMVRSTLKRLMVPELPAAHDHGEPAKVSATSSIKSEAGDLSNYDDLLDTAIKSEEQTTTPELAVNNQAKKTSSDIAISDAKPASKHIPTWIWVIAGIAIFVTTAFVLLYIINR